MLLLAGTQILGGHVYDTVGVDIKGHLDLRHAPACRRDTVQTELAEGFVVSCKLPLALHNIDVNRCLIVGRC